jgi:hypothetical protein
MSDDNSQTQGPLPKRGRGRPPGSTNKEKKPPKVGKAVVRIVSKKKVYETPETKELENQTNALIAEYNKQQGIIVGLRPSHISKDPNFGLPAEELAKLPSIKAATSTDAKEFIAKPKPSNKPKPHPKSKPFIVDDDGIIDSDV